MVMVMIMVMVMVVVIVVVVEKVVVVALVLIIKNITAPTNQKSRHKIITVEEENLQRVERGDGRRHLLHHVAAHLMAPEVQ